MALSDYRGTELQFNTGGRPYNNKDFRVMQQLTLDSASFFEAFQNINAAQYIVSGCVNLGDGGFVWMGVYDLDPAISTKKLRFVSPYTGPALTYPCYIIENNSIQQRAYKDGQSKNVFATWLAQWSQTIPASGSYITFNNAADLLNFQLKTTLATIGVSFWVQVPSTSNIEYTGGNVGIGIAPLQALHVKGNVRVDNDVNTGSATMVQGSATQSGYIEFRTPAAVRQGYLGWIPTNLGLTLENNHNLIINGNGFSPKVAINSDQSAPAAPLHIKPTNISAVQEGIRLEDPGTGASEGLYIRWDSSGKTDQARIGQISEGSGAGSDIYFSTNAADSGAASEKMRIMASGRVGIGTAGPDSALHVSTGSGVPVIHAQSTVSSGYGSTLFYGSITQGDSSAYDLLGLYNGSGKRVGFRGDGQVVFNGSGGVTVNNGNVNVSAGALSTSSSITAGNGLTVSNGNASINAGNLTVTGMAAIGNSNQTAIGSHPTYGSGYAAVWYNNGSDYALLSNGGNTYLNSNSGGTTHLRVNNNDILTVTGSLVQTYVSLQVSGTGTATDWIATSDASLKSDILDITNALDKTLLLKGHTYKRIDAFEPERIHYGFIAQEVEQVVPEFVHFIDAEKKLKGVDYDKVSALLVEAIKEQQKLIQELKERIQVLESK